MTFQRVICLLSIIASAVVFLYSLGLMTDLFDMLYNMIPDPSDPDTVKVAGAMIYYDMQDFNRLFLRLSIALILCSCVLFITNTHRRRKYYIGNYLATALAAAANIGVAIWASSGIAAFKARYLGEVDFAQLERRLSRAGTFTDSTFWFDARYFVFALALAVSLLLILNALWKIKLMKEEKGLIEAGKAVSA